VYGGGNGTVRHKQEAEQVPGLSSRRLGLEVPHAGEWRMWLNATASSLPICKATHAHKPKFSAGGEMRR
jgi:hypothetical protein